MKERIEKFFFFVLENLPTLMAVGFSVYIVLRSQTVKMDTNDLLLWILSLIGLLSTSILVERLARLRRIEHFSEMTYNYLLKREGRPSIDLVFSDRKALQPLETRLQSAKEIAITGGSLYRLTNEYLGYFEQKIQDGCTIKFLLIHPDSEAAKLVAEHVVYEASDHNVYRNQIRTSLANLYRISQQHTNLIEIRTCQFVPPFSLLILDPTKAYGSISVELYAHTVPTRERPEFLLQAANEPHWYKFFLRQFEQVWNESSPWLP